MTRDEAKRVLATVLRYTACDADYAYDKKDGGTELVPGQDIADAICMALAALNEQEERRWIPVTERLPETQVEVLTYSECNGVRSACLLASNGETMMWYLCRSDKLSVAVTHWMPLPEPPKEEKNC